MQVDGRTQVAVTCDPLAILNLLKRDFLPMNLMCEQAGMTERGIYDRTKAVFEYFNLPFDEEPPLEGFSTGDFLGERDPVRRAGVGRNDPCPCGSGKKYKKCCGKT